VVAGEPLSILLTEIIEGSPFAAIDSNSSVSETSAEVQNELQRIEDGVSHIRFPLAFSDQVYNLRSHIEIVRRRTTGRKNLSLAAE